MGKIEGLKVEEILKEKGITVPILAATFQSEFAGFSVYNCPRIKTGKMISSPNTVILFDKKMKAPNYVQTPFVINYSEDGNLDCIVVAEAGDNAKSAADEILKMINSN